MSLEWLLRELGALNGLELGAVVLAIAYLLLAVRQNIWCWSAAFASTAIYLYLFFQARLYMESALQVFYLAMAVYGWRRWRQGGADRPGLPVSTCPPAVHGAAVALVLGLSALSGWLLERYTGAAFPYLDSLTTWGAVWATYLVARKKLENWLYWIVIDSLGIYLYHARGLELTAVLFALYVFICVFGYIGWQRDWQENRMRGHEC